MTRLAVRAIAVFFLALLALLLTASASATNSVVESNSPPSTSSSTTTTLAAPHLVQTTLTFSENGLRFSDTALVAIPAKPLPKFFLRLSSDVAAIKCTATQLQPPSNYGGAVNGFRLVCDASSLPTLFAPTLEVFVANNSETFVPVAILNNTNGALDDWLPFVLGVFLAMIALAVAWSMSNLVSVNKTVSADVAWSASDSWVTNVAAIGALLTGVAGAASSSLGNVLPGLPAARIEILAVAFVALLALGPLLYGLFTTVPAAAPNSAALQATLDASLIVRDLEGNEQHRALHAALGGADSTSTKRVGTVKSDLIASTATLIAVFGELTTLGILVSLSTAQAAVRALLYIGIGLGSAVVMFYSVQSVHLLIDERQRKESNASLLSQRGLVSGTL